MHSIHSDITDLDKAAATDVSWIHSIHSDITGLDKVAATDVSWIHSVHSDITGLDWCELVHSDDTVRPQWMVEAQKHSTSSCASCTVLAEQVIVISV